MVVEMGSKGEQMIPPDVEQDVKSIADDAYAQAGAVHKQSAKEAPFLRFCTATSLAFARELRTLGYDCRIVGIYHELGMTHHDVVLMEKDECRALVDPTWKQFIGVDDANIYGLPDVLILPIVEEWIEIPEFVPEKLRWIYERINEKLNNGETL